MTSLDDLLADTRKDLAAIFTDHDGVLVAFSGGKDSLALLHLVEPWRDQVTVLWVNTGAHVPHVEAFIRERLVGWRVDERRSDQASHWRSHGLPSVILPTPRTIKSEPKVKVQSWHFCCHTLRFQPMLDALSEGHATIMLAGQRRQDDADPINRLNEYGNGSIVNPLWDWSDDDVLMFIENEEIPLPWHYAEITDSLDCWNCTGHIDSKKVMFLKNYYPDLANLVISGRRRIAVAVREALEFEEAVTRAGSSQVSCPLWIDPSCI